MRDTIILLTKLIHTMRTTLLKDKTKSTGDDYALLMCLILAFSSSLESLPSLGVSSTSSSSFPAPSSNAGLAFSKCAA